MSLPSVRRWLTALGHVVEPTHNAAGAVHGTAIAAALIAGTPEHADLAQTVVAVPATLLVYWIAFSYAHFIGGRMAGEPIGWLRGLRHSLAEEWSIVESSLLPLVILVVATLAGVDLDVAAWTAVGSAVALMFGWGQLATHRSGLTGAARWAGGVTSALVGALVIVLKIGLKYL